MTINDLIQSGRYSDALVLIDSSSLDDWKKLDFKIQIYFQLRETEKVSNAIDEFITLSYGDKIKKFKADLYQLKCFVKCGNPQEGRLHVDRMDIIIDELDEHDVQELEILALYYHEIGTLHLTEGNNIEAEHHLLLARAYRGALQNLIDLAGTLNNLGVVYVRKGMHHIAIEFYNEALEIFTKLDNKMNQAMIRNNLGILHSGRGELNLAKKYQEQNLVLYTDQGNMDDIGRSLTNLGEIYRQFGDYEYASKLLEESLEFKIEDGNPQNIFNSYYYLAICLIESQSTENLDATFNELNFYLEKNPTVLNKTRYEYVQALNQFFNYDITEQEKMIQKFESLIDKEIVDPDVTYQSIMYLIQILFKELLDEKNTVYLEQVYQLLDKLERQSKKSQHHLYYLKSILLRAKLSIIQGEFTLSEELYQQALEIASEYDLQVYKHHIRTELDQFKQELSQSTSLTDKHFSLLEKIEESMINDYINDVKKLVDLNADEAA